MVVRKPIEKEPSIQAFINNGASVKQDKVKESLQVINIRIKKNLLEEVDESVSKRVGHVSRTTWILEAITEKLNKENGNDI